MSIPSDGLPHYGRSYDWSTLLNDATQRSITYLASLNSRAVTPTDDALLRLTTLDEPLPDHLTDPADVIALLDDIGSPATVATAGDRFFGFVVGGSLPATVAASWLATAWDQEAGSSVTSPVASIIEEVASRWLLDVLGLPPASGTGFVTGATMANFSCLAAARHALLAREGWDVEQRGLFGAPPITVVVSDEVHVSVLKALGLLGLGRERVVRVPTDGQGRMRADGLPALDGPAIVCLQAGNVNTGAFDPAPEITRWARMSDAWTHVDGAFGLWAAASPARAHLVEGFAEADSWATDAHKWLNVPYDSGLAIVRDSGALRAAMGTSAAYLVQSSNREPDQFTPEMSRRARGIEVWAALRSLGRNGLADLIDRTCRHAERLAAGLSAAGYEVMNDVVLNQALVSFGSSDVTRRVIAAIQSDATCWFGGTVWQGRPAMRMSVSSWATTDESIERSLSAILRVARDVSP